MNNRVAINGEDVCYRETGKGISVLILPGVGTAADRYYPFQDGLSAIGYKVYLVDLPGFQTEKPKFVPLEEWASWVDDVAKNIVKDKFVLISHSLSTRVGLLYLSSVKQNCVGGIFLNPVFATRFEGFIWWGVGAVVRIFRLYSRFPKDIEWLRKKEKETHKTAGQLICHLRDEEQPRVPCLILISVKDPLRRLFSA